jgi:hypothetical protein
MKSVLGFTVSMIILVFCEQLSKKLYLQVNVESLRKVDQGLGPYQAFRKT